jgi:hypothetical protein
MGEHGMSDQQNAATARLAHLNQLLAEEQASANPSKTYMDDLKISIEFAELQKDKALIFKA